MKIRTLLIILLVCFTIIPSVAFAVTSNIYMQDLALTNYTNTTRSLAERQSFNISEYFKTLSRTAEQIAKDPYVTAFTEKGNEKLIKNLIENYNTIIENTGNEATPIGINKIIIADGTGDALYYTGDNVTVTSALKTTLKNISEAKDGEVYCYTDDVYADYTQGDDEQLDPLFGEDASSQTRLVTKYKSGDYSVIVFFGEKTLKSFFTMSSFANNSRIVLIDANGSIIDGTYIGNTSDSKNSAYGRLVDNAGTDSANQLNNFKGESAPSIPTIGFTKKMPVITDGDQNWTLAMIAETSKAYTASSEAASGITAAIVLISILFCVAGVALVVVITKPIKSIEETLSKVRRGDHEARINIIAKNEYGEIARAFNDLIDDIIVSEGRYRTIIEMSDNIIFEWNFKTNDVIFSNNFNQKFSYRAPSDHFGDSFLLKVKVHPEDSEKYHKDLEKLSKGEEFKHNEYRWKNIYGDYIWILMRTATIRNRDGDIAKIVGVIVDIDRAKKSEKLLTERASYDSLTGLYNRESIERAIDTEIELISARKNPFAILFIDIDDFKIFNDKYSHATGDQVLKFVADTIAKVIEGFGTAGRYGGDEFIACIRNLELNDPSRVAKDILNALQEGFVSDNGDKLSVNSSIGITVIEDAAMRVDEIIGMADDAMYKIKKSGKSNFGILNKQQIAPPAPVQEEVEETEIGGNTSQETKQEPGTVSEENKADEKEAITE